MTPEEMADALAEMANARDRLEDRQTLMLLRLASATARTANPRAKYLILDDSDQGPYSMLSRVEDVHRNDLDDAYEACEETGWDVSLADHLRPDVEPYTDGLPWQRRNPWSGTRIDIDLVLAAPEGGQTVLEPAPRHYVLLTDNNDAVMLVSCSDLAQSEAVGSAAIWSEGGVSAWLLPKYAVTASQWLVDQLRAGESVQDMHHQHDDRGPYRLVSTTETETEEQWPI